MTIVNSTNSSDVQKNAVKPKHYKNVDKKSFMWLNVHWDY